jgi:hypothetical protein
MKGKGEKETAREETRGQLPLNSASSDRDGRQ